MTDEKPRDVPPWLTTDGEALWLRSDAYALLDEIKAGADLAGFLRWRSELAEALGLVDREAVQGLIARLESNDVPEPLCYLDHTDRDAMADLLRRAVGEDERLNLASAKEWAEHDKRVEGKAVAAELRAQAEALSEDPNTGGGPNSAWGSGVAAGVGAAIGLLRARADALDPPTTE